MQSRDNLGEQPPPGRGEKGTKRPSGSPVGHVPSGSQTQPCQVWSIGSRSDYHAPAKAGKQDTYGVLCP